MKHLTNNRRIRALVEKHSAALAQEITQELSLRLLEQFDDPATPPEEEVEPTATIAVRYDTERRCWVCPSCGYYDLRRRAVTTHARYCEGIAEPVNFARTRSTKPVKSRKKKP
jgi:hypothetical protein